MLELTGSTGKIVGNSPGIIRMLGQDVNKAVVLRHPRDFIQNKAPLKNSYLESLIQENIIKKNHDSERSNHIAEEVRALINSLSEHHEKKLVEILQAWEPHKEMIRGVIFSGGEIRVVAESGPAMVINTIVELLGITYSKENPNPTFKNFSGASAGSFQAAGMAFRTINSNIFKNSADTDFTSFYRSPETLENWVNNYMRIDYHHATGKFTDVVRGKHLHEVGSGLEVLVGETGRRFLQMPKTYLLPRELPKFGIDPDNFPIMSAVRATANLPILFYPLRDLFGTCGNCYLEDSRGRKHYLFDAGLFQKNMLPLNLLTEEVESYKKGKIDKPAFYFIVGNKKARGPEAPETMFGRPTPKLAFWLYSTGVSIADWIDKHIIGEPTENLKQMGAQRTYIEANCEAKDPFSNKIARFVTGGFDVSREDRETLICANIPTSDFKDLSFESAIDQMHRKFVDPIFITSKGREGKSAYELYLQDINIALGKEKPSGILRIDGSKSKFSATQFLKDAQNAAATL